MSSHRHDHGTDSVSDAALLWAVGLNIGLSAFEGIAGYLAGSVALYADALHNFNDCAALFIAYVARHVARTKPDARYTFGRRRAELIGAMINLTTLVVIGLILIKEAGERFLHPTQPDGGWIMAASGVALLVDIGTVWLLWAMSRGSLNIRSAFIHNLTDALASVAVLFGGAAVWWFGWSWVDPAISLLIAGFVLYTSLGLMRRTAHILMEGAPEDLSLDELCQAVCAMEVVKDLHHLHVWQLDENQRALEAHLVVPPDRLSDSGAIRRQVKDLLKSQFGIGHATLEVETSDDRCEDASRYPDHES